MGKCILCKSSVVYAMTGSSVAKATKIFEIVNSQTTYCLTKQFFTGEFFWVFLTTLTKDHLISTIIIIIAMASCNCHGRPAVQKW